MGGKLNTVSTDRLHLAMNDTYISKVNKVFSIVCPRIFVWTRPPAPVRNAEELAAFARWTASGTPQLMNVKLSPKKLFQVHNSNTMTVPEYVMGVTNAGFL